MPSIDELQSQITAIENKLKDMPQHFGVRFTDALVSPNFSSGTSGWKIGEDGDVEFNSGTFRTDLIIGDADGQRIEILGTSGFIDFYSKDNTLQASIEALDVTNDGVDGLQIHTTDGAGYDYLFTSAGFTMAGGTFEGDVAINSGTPANDELSIGNKVISATPERLVIFGTDDRTGSDGWQLTLDTYGGTISSTDNVVTRKLPIKVDGTQYFILMTTSSS